MTAAPKQATGASNVLSRAGFLKTAAIGLIGAAAGAGVAGQPVEHVAAAEPLVETCEGYVVHFQFQREL